MKTYLIQKKMRFNRVFFAALGLAALLLAGCQDAKVTDGQGLSKYSKKELTIMMRYHGSLVARFDGKQWWCLQGRRWIKVDSAKAARLARLKSSRKNHSL